MDHCIRCDFIDCVCGYTLCYKCKLPHNHCVCDKSCEHCNRAIPLCECLYQCPDCNWPIKTCICDDKIFDFDYDGYVNCVKCNGTSSRCICNEYCIGCKMVKCICECECMCIKTCNKCNNCNIDCICTRNEYNIIPRYQYTSCYYCESVTIDRCKSVYCYYKCDCNNLCLACEKINACCTCTSSTLTLMIINSSLYHKTLTSLINRYYNNMNVESVVKYRNRISMIIHIFNFNDDINLYILSYLYYDYRIFEKF